MNAAELATAMTFLGCPVVAGLIALSQKAGWFTLLFIAAGLAVGLACAEGVHILAYRLLDIAGRQTRAAFGWAWLLTYTAVPQALAFGSITLTAWLTHSIAGHLL